MKASVALSVSPLAAATGAFIRQIHSLAATPRSYSPCRAKLDRPQLPARAGKFSSASFSPRRSRLTASPCGGRRESVEPAGAYADGREKEREAQCGDCASAAHTARGEVRNDEQATQRWRRRLPMVGRQMSENKLVSLSLSLFPSLSP